MSKTQAQLIAEINANYPDNNVGYITPALQRATLIDVLTGTINVNPQALTTYTLQESDNGAIISMGNAGPSTLICPSSLPVGFNCVVEQEGAGQITFTPGAGATLQSPGGANKSLQQYSTAYVFVISNNDGLTAAQFRLSGMITV